MCSSNINLPLISRFMNFFPNCRWRVQRRRMIQAKSSPWRQNWQLYVYTLATKINSCRLKIVYISSPPPSPLSLSSKPPSLNSSVLLLKVKLRS